MIGPRWQLFRLFGIPLYVDLSWFVIVVLITWSLATRMFAHPEWFPELAGQPGTRWAMGLAGALGLFASIVVHELGHAKMAERHGVPMRGITLFIFGGVAEMSREPPSAKAEFLVAIAGPVMSVAVAAVALAGWCLGGAVEAPRAVTVVLGYLGFINLLLVAFNMLPAFPLDGGRVLRSALWAWRDDLRWATRVTSGIGAGFGLALIFLAALQLLGGNLIGAIWWFILGLFLRGAAQMAYQQLEIRRSLEGELLDRFMTEQPETVSPDHTVEQVVEDFVYRSHHKLYPVVRDGSLEGCITVDAIKKVPRDEWATTRVGDVREARSPENTIERGSDAMAALSRLRERGRSRMMVVDGDRLVGVVSLKDLMEFLALKVELDERAG